MSDNGMAEASDPTLTVGPPRDDTARDQDQWPIP
jgi:hypothetical protein